MTGELIGAAEAGLYGLQLLTTITLVASHSVIPSFREPEQKHLVVLQSRVVKKGARFTLPLSGSTQWTAVDSVAGLTALLSAYSNALVLPLFLLDLV